MDYFIQEINYSENPDFKNNIPIHPNFSLAEEIAIRETIDFIDAYINYFTSNNITNASQKFSEAIEEKINDLKKLIVARTAQDKELCEALLLVLSTAIEHAKNYLNYIIKTNGEDLAISLNKEDDEHLANLKNDGFLEFQIPQTAEFLSMCDELLEINRKKYQGLDDWRGANSLEQDSKEYKFLDKFISDHKIVELISAYKKMKMEVYYMASDYSHHRQKWFRNNHTFNKLAPTNYYHYDADADVAKMLIYLSDVKSEDGPFRFVKSSNNLARSIFLTYIYYSIDTKISPLFQKKENLYGRGLFLYRKDLLMKFPKVFMGSTHFGDDLNENSSLSQYLIEKTTVFNRNKGAVILFDGFKGIHAGGNAEKGERLAVQVAFKKIETRSSSGSQNSVIKKIAKRLLGQQ